ncbi:hypothetical protein Indivirus_5_55 [Indivirus ILV1]|uniref:Uncharacterized protein n=1 Tax=Indivirus ILV1 TaxID=1977633 RepID=A0A1V0SE06_9VIRU|nr:hypothetical protein Indivirus_5_55 [Indivirus ILV1]
MTEQWIIFVLVVIIVMLSIVKTNRQIDKENTIKTLIRQAARWSLASTQDESSMISVLHANYGAGYLWAVRDIATDDEIKNTTGVDILKFRDEITKIQDNATKKMAKLCPNYAPKSTYLSEIAGDV